MTATENHADALQFVCAPTALKEKHERYYKSQDTGSNTNQSLEMLHEYLKTDVIRKYRLTSTSAWRRSIHRRRHVRRRRVQLRQQKPRLASSLIADDVPRYGEPVDQQILRVRHGRLQQFLEVRVLLPFLIPLFPPLRYHLTVEDQDVEEGIQQ